MKIRLDLLEHLTMEDIAEVALANNPRYKPEPLFSKTGTGSLRLWARGGAQHGINSESGGAAGANWEARRGVEQTLGEALDELRGYHRRAPFLFFNGNTFADIARGLSALLFRELPPTRLKQLTSAVAHYVAACWIANLWLRL